MFAQIFYSSSRIGKANVHLADSGSFRSEATSFPLDQLSGRERWFQPQDQKLELHLSASHIAHAQLRERVELLEADRGGR